MIELSELSVIIIVVGLMGLNVLSYYSHKLKLFPEIIWVLIAGLLYGFLSTNLVIGLPVIQLNVSIVLYVFVPILIFASAQKICLFHFKKVLLSASINASLGVLISMVVIALPIHYLFSVPLLEALLFGVVVSATDPLAIGALLSKNKKIDQSKKLLIEGESILNDGFVVTMFGILFSLIYSHEMFSIGGSSLSLIINVCGALVVGAILGRLARALLFYWHEEHFTLRMNMTVALAFGSFLLSESFHFSGIIGVFAAALAYGYKPDKNAQNIEAQKDVWEYLEYIANACLFFLLGASASSIATFDGFGFFHVFAAILLIVVSRFISVISLWPITIIDKKRLTTKEFWLMNFAGARGAVSIALLLLIPDESEFKELFISLAFVMIFFTLIVNPLLMQRQLNKD